MDGFEYDVFVSYRYEDAAKNWVERVLVPRLEAARLNVCWDRGRERFLPGRELRKEITRSIRSSRWTIAVISPGYMQGEFSVLEAELATGRLIPVLRNHAELPQLMREVIAIDLSDDRADSEAWKKLFSAIQRRPDEGLAPSSPARSWLWMSVAAVVSLVAAVALELSLGDSDATEIPAQPSPASNRRATELKDRPAASTSEPPRFKTGITEQRGYLVGYVSGAWNSADIILEKNKRFRLAKTALIAELRRRGLPAELADDAEYCDPPASVASGQAMAWCVKIQSN